MNQDPSVPFEAEDGEMSREVMFLARKIVKVYLPPSQKKVLDRMCISLGMAESEALRTAFLEYAKSLGLMTEQIRSDRLS